MNIALEIILNIEGTRSLHRGNFPVNVKDFNEDPDFTAAVVAYEWIQKLRQQTGYRDTVIEKVVYNGGNEITEIVRQIRPIIKDDDLPF